jgi:predicted transposase YdaD
MRRDSIFYQLFRQLPTLLFELIPQAPDNADRYTFDSVEVKETAFSPHSALQFLRQKPASEIIFSTAISSLILVK